MNNILYESSRGITSVEINDMLLKDRILYIDNTITSEYADEIIQKLIYLECDDNENNITICINSPGGEVDSGLAIYDTMVMMKSPITVVCIGMAYSIAALLFLAGDPDKRYMFPHSKLMLHGPSYLNRDISGLKSEEIFNIADELQSDNDMINQIIIDRTGLSREVVENITKNDSYFNVDKAIEHNLASHVVEDFSIFKKGRYAL